MKISYKVSVGALAVSSLLGFALPVTALAATTPSLGAAAGYSLYGDAGVTNTGAGTHVWGNVGDNSLGHPGLLGTQVDGTIGAGAGVAGAAGTAYGALDAQGATGSLDLAGTHTVTPGVYTVGATTLNGTLTLDGAGVYIFRSDSSITTSGAGTVNLINGATACNVFWQVPTSMTIGAGSHVEGTIIAQTGLISLATGATLVGRALAHTQVTLDSNQITEPICGGTPPPPAPVYGCMDVTATNYDSSATSQTGVACTYSVVTSVATSTVVVNTQATTTTITVIKMVINDNGGTRTVASFPLFVNGTPVVSGVTNTFPVGIYAMNETGASNYTRTFSGDCDSNGVMNLASGDNKTCTITNNDNAAVIVPKLPNTGLSPQSRTPWDIFITAGILMVVSVSLVLALKKRTV